MKEFTYDEATYSDLFKDVYGFRPRSGRFYADDATPEEKQEIWDRLLAELEIAVEEEKSAQNESVKSFEALLNTISSGAVDRATAIKWIRDAYEDDYMKYDDSYFRYTFNLPYDYKL